MPQKENKMLIYSLIQKNAKKKKIKKKIKSHKIWHLKQWATPKVSYYEHENFK